MYKRIYIEITNICNLNCDFCPSTKRLKKYMTLDEFDTILNKIDGYTNNIYLHIKGEPLMHPQLDNILKSANKHNMNVNITTNARLLNQKLSILNNNKIRQINISLHSFNNLEEIEKLLNDISNLKNMYVSLRLWNNNDNKEILNLLGKYYNKEILFTGKRFTLSNNIFLSKDVLFDWPDINKEIVSTTGTCLGLKEQLGILVDGSITTCCLDNEGDNTFGNIFESNLTEIINCDRYQEILNGFCNNILVSDLCKRCGYRKRFKRGENNKKI